MLAIFIDKVKIIGLTLRQLFGKKVAAYLMHPAIIIYLHKSEAWLYEVCPKFDLYFTIVVGVFIVSQGIADAMSRGMTSFQNRRAK